MGLGYFFMPWALFRILTYSLSCAIRTHMPFCQIFNSPVLVLTACPFCYSVVGQVTYKN
jgi:predicted aminopeptidase